MGTETEEKVQQRLRNAIGEIEFSRRVSFYNHRFVLDKLSNGHVPCAVWQLIDLLLKWYPSLGELPPDLIVFSAFASADAVGKNLIQRNLVEQLLQELVPGRLGKEFRGLIDPACNEDGLVDYKVFVERVFTKQ